MKLIISILTLLLLNCALSAQQFASVGTVWHYCQMAAFTPDGYENFLKVESVKDTLIEDKLCQEIQCDWLCWHPHDIQYVYASGDSIFLYDPLLEDFKLIYDFGGSAGDSIVIPIGDSYFGMIDTVVLFIDSVELIQINSVDLRKQYVTYFVIDTFPGGNQMFSYTSEIIETIGDVDYVFNIPIEASQVCDANYSCGLRCYEDFNLGHYETGIAPDCEYMYVSISEPKVNSLDVYPNPASNIITIRNSFEGQYHIYLFDSYGRKLRHYESEHEISLEDLPDGVYYINIVDSQKNLYLEKVVKYGGY